MSKFSMLNLYEATLVLVMYLTLCHANSAGVGVPCCTASGCYGQFLGHPTRGDLQTFQDQLDLEEQKSETPDAAAITAIKEKQKEKMHEVENLGYKMYWALPPVHSAKYTVRTGDSKTVGDPTTWTPNQWINIYVRALDEGEKFTGLVMYAMDSRKNTVGEWHVDTDTGFRYGGDGMGGWCVTHRNAEYKNYRNVFRFKAPAAGTGTITFHAVVKVGLAFPVLDGNFYFPNTQPLTLTEAAAVTQRWFEGPPGQSCDEVCTSIGGQCDLNSISSSGNSRDLLYDVAKKVSPRCTEPIMIGCSPFTPSVGSEGCFYHDQLCGVLPPTPAFVRQDPCLGLQTINGGRNLQPMECVKWAFQQQNNNPGKDAYNGIYSNGELVKVCNKGMQQNYFQNQDGFGGNQNNYIAVKCAPVGGYTPAPTITPPPPRLKGDTTCSAKATTNPEKDGSRLCFCTGSVGTLPPTDGFPTPLGFPTPMGPPRPPPLDSGVTRSSPKMVLIGAVVLLSSMNSLGGRIPKFFSVLSLALSVNAHNWMSSPSRANNNFNAYQTAPCPPRGSRVHFQVAAGQKFPMEYATGHSTPARGGTYLTVMRAEDEAQMIKHTRALLDDYLASAPAGTAPYMAEHKAHHVGSTATSTTTTDVSAQLAASYGVGLTSNNIRDFGPNWGNKPPGAAPIYPKKESYTADDLRVKYTNPNYPWIISCHKFKLHEDKSEEADLVMMEIPVGSPVGQYVVQYSWNGYYDCTDVNVIADQSTDFYGSPATVTQFDRLDHCLWNPVYAGYSVLGTCREIAKGESADACFVECDDMANDACYGVQVVPAKLSPTLTANGMKGMFQGRTSTMPPRCSTDLPNVADDSLVCFPIQQGRSVVGSTYDVTTDPLDSIFYGTCYTKGGAWNFAQTPPVGAVVPKGDIFNFGEQECISCDTMRSNRRDDIVPFWEITYDTCEHCDRTLG